MLACKDPHMGWQICAWDVKEIRNQRTRLWIGRSGWHLCVHYYSFLGLARDISDIFGQPQRCVLGSSPQKDLAIALQGVLDSLKLILPLGSTTVSFNSRARYSWAVIGQELSMAKSLGSGHFCSTEETSNGLVLIQSFLLSWQGLLQVGTSLSPRFSLPHLVLHCCIKNA